MQRSCTDSMLPGNADCFCLHGEKIFRSRLCLALCSYCVVCSYHCKRVLHLDGDLATALTLRGVLLPMQQGRFTLMEMHTWVGLCLPDVPTRPPSVPDVTLYFRSCVLGSHLIWCRPAVF